MAHFETFRRSLLPLKTDPQVTIQRRGMFSLNRSAFLALGSPGAVELLYDKDDRIVGLRPVEASARHAYHVRQSTRSSSGPFVVSAMAFTKFYDINTSLTQRWVAYMDDGVLCVNLSADPAAVISA